MYSSQPAEVAPRWESEGAERLHVVDLDGASSGVPTNLKEIQEIVSAISIPIQFGGGVRSAESIDQMLGLGVERVILGSRALKDPDFMKEMISTHGDSVIIGVDAHDGKVAIHGWQDTSEITAAQFAREIQEAGGKRIIFTGIERDGTLEGPNLERLEEVLDAVDIPVISSGGIGYLNHIESLIPLVEKGVEGVIVGKAVYEGTVSLPKAIELVR